MEQEQYIRLAIKEGIRAVIKQAQRDLIEDMYNSDELETSIYLEVKNRFNL